MIITVGELTGKEQPAIEMTIRIQAAFDEIVPLENKLSIAYLIWKDPYMAAGGGTFIDDMLNRCGFKNIYKNNARYPEVTSTFSSNKPKISSDSLSTLCDSYPPPLSDCRLLLLSSEPYPFKAVHLQQLQSQLPGCRIMLVEGEMFSWYGSRLLLAAEYFKKLIRQIQG